MTNDDRPSGNSDERGSDPAMPSMGMLVIRTWHEPYQAPSFRGGITYSQDPGGERPLILARSQASCASGSLPVLSRPVTSNVLYLVVTTARRRGRLMGFEDASPMSSFSFA